MTESNESPLRLIVSMQLHCSWVRSVPWRRSDNPMIAFKGVRISWLMLARKSDLAFVADSAFSFAFLSSSSVCLLAIAPPMEAAAAWRIAPSTPIQRRSEWQSSNRMKPQNRPSTAIGIAMSDFVFWGSNTALSDSGNSRIKPLIECPIESTSYQRDNLGWYVRSCKSGLSFSDITESRSHLWRTLARYHPDFNSWFSKI